MSRYNMQSGIQEFRKVYRGVVLAMSPVPVLDALRETVERCEMSHQPQLFPTICEASRLAAWEALRLRLVGSETFLSAYRDTIRLCLRGYACSELHYATNARDRVSDLANARSVLELGIQGKTIANLILTWVWREFRRESTANQDQDYGLEELATICKSARELANEVNETICNCFAAVLDIIYTRTDKIEVAGKVAGIFDACQRDLLLLETSDSIAVSWGDEIKYISEHDCYFQRPQYPVAFVEVDIKTTIDRKSETCLGTSKDDYQKDWNDMDIRKDAVKGISSQQVSSEIDYSLLLAEPYPYVAYEIVEASDELCAVPLFSAASHNELRKLTDAHPEIALFAQYVNTDSLATNYSDLLNESLALE
ncbi:MAG: hypothetical protein R3C53_18930 [Pirellulaceae bacterium]